MSISQNENIMKFISHNFLYLRKEHNITKREMAKLLGIGIKSLDKIERGLLPPGLSANVLFKAQEYFGVPMHILVSVKIGIPSET